jgi:hypothetical protein
MTDDHVVDDETLEEWARKVAGWREAADRWRAKHPDALLIAEADVLIAEAFGLIWHHGGDRKLSGARFVR